MNDPLATPLVSAALLTKLGVKTPGDWPLALSSALTTYGITAKPMIAAFLANAIHETGGLVAFVENLNYSVAALTATWPSHFTPALAQAFGRGATPANQPMIAELAYGGRMGNRAPGYGDGIAFKGRGLFQLTGRDNYTAYAKAKDYSVADLPSYLETPQGAADSAGWFFRDRGCLPPALRGDIAGVRKIINGGAIGLPQVTALYQTALGSL